MPTLQICVIDHREDDFQPLGPIIAPYVMRPGMEPGDRYADFCALYGMWAGYIPRQPDIVGFFGYRKYLCPLDSRDYGWLEPAHAPGWYQCEKKDFDIYRQALAEYDGSDIKQLLAQHDVLQAAPFPLTEEVWEDFARSRSRLDAQTILDVIGPSSSDRIYPYLFITRWPIFNRMMTELDPLRRSLDKQMTGVDSQNIEYKKRPMAYIMERLYSRWLEQSGLSIKEIPLLHCWEMGP